MGIQELLLAGQGFGDGKNESFISFGHTANIISYLRCTFDTSASRILRIIYTSSYFCRYNHARPYDGNNTRMICVRDTLLMRFWKLAIYRMLVLGPVMIPLQAMHDLDQSLEKKKLGR